MEKERLPLRELETNSPITLKESATVADETEGLTSVDRQALSDSEAQSERATDAQTKPGSSSQSSIATAKTRTLPHIGEDMEVLAFIGEGGMGSVYRVLDKRLDKEFAVKHFRQELASDKTKLARFKQEVDSATNLDHPNLVTVYNHAIASDGTPYMVKDFVNGSSLAEILARDVFLEPV